MSELAQPFECDGFWMRTWIFDFWSVDVVLRIDNGRVRLMLKKPRNREPVLFDVPRESITDVVLPRYNFGCVVKLKAAGRPYRITFARASGGVLDIDGVVIPWSHPSGPGPLTGMKLGKEVGRRLLDGRQ